MARLEILAQRANLKDFAHQSPLVPTILSDVPSRRCKYGRISESAGLTSQLRAGILFQPRQSETQERGQEWNEHRGFYVNRVEY